MKQCPTCGEVYEEIKTCPCPPRGGARAGAGKKPIFDEALERVSVSLDPQTIAFYKHYGNSLSEGIRNYWRGLTQRAGDTATPSDNVTVLHK
jgi:hypothetical protein